MPAQEINYIDPNGPDPSDRDLWLELAGPEGRVTATEAAQTAQGRGLTDPNVGTIRLLGYPRVMADPPTITAGTSGGSSVIADEVRVAVVTAKGAASFSKFGGTAPLGETFPLDGFWAPLNAYQAGDVDVMPAYWAVEFEWYGQEFETILRGSGSGRVRLVIGQEYDVWAGRDDTDPDGAEWLIHYDFGSPAFRQIRLEFDANVGFAGLNIGPNDSVWPSSKPRGPKVIVTGDSFTEAFYSWPAAMGLCLGWRDLGIVGRGSTGYLDELLGDDTFRGRAAKDIYPWEPDIVVIGGGLNDNSFDAALVGAEAATFYQEIKSELPGVTLIVSGFNRPRGQDGVASWFLTRDAIREAAEEYADLYIEQVGGPYPYSGSTSDYNDTGWMTGNGFAGATTGTGNSDIFVSADGVHPNELGQFYRGFRVAQAIAASMPIIGGS